MKRLTVCFFLIVASIGPVFAHETKQSGNILVFLHTNPDDYAVTYKKENFYVLLTNNGYAFPIETCDCHVEVHDTDGNLFSNAQITSTQSAMLVPYYFTKAGIAQIRVSGTPKVAGTFEPFSLTFDVRVNRGSWLELFHSRKVMAGSLGVILVGLGAGEYLIKRKRKHTQK